MLTYFQVLDILNADLYTMMRQGSMPILKLPRRVPIAMKDKFKQELDSMEAQGMFPNMMVGMLAQNG